jgi:hypothetical protein
MHRATQNFFALLAMLDSAREPRSQAQAAAAGIVRHEILPILAAGFETYPEKDVSEILTLCEPALIDVLQHIIER